MVVTELSDVVDALNKAGLRGADVKQITDPRSLRIQINQVEKKQEGDVVKKAFSVLYDTMGLGTISPKYDSDAKVLTLNYDMSGRAFLGVPGCGESMAYRPE